MKGGEMSELKLGVVAWYDIVKGYGVITGQDNHTYFLHKSNISPNFGEIVKDSLIEFEVSQNKFKERLDAINIRKPNHKNDPSANINFETTDKFEDDEEVTKSTYKLTEEQIKIIYHPDGQHARVLAVAGSGKTTTMARRIKYLVTERGEKNIDPSSILVLMFNRLAERQFKDKLSELEIPEEKHPEVKTFHKIAYSIITRKREKDRCPKYKDMKEHEEDYLIKTILESFVKITKSSFDENSIDPNEVKQAIQLWKAELTPPEFAKYHGNPKIPMVSIYKKFEEERMNKNALTYNDSIPLAVDFLTKDEELRSDFSRQLKYLIIDEYQDVNFGQQELIKLLMGTDADLMIVGDDDQTIYEWRGTRPDFILEKFKEDFSNKNFKDYQLTYSFRFGPVISQCAYNSISENKKREKKLLLSKELEKQTELIIYDYDSKNMDPNKELAYQIKNLSESIEQNKYKDIIVLCRMYAQLVSLETELLKQEIPYYILDREPFFCRKEIDILLKYLYLSMNYEKKLNKEIVEKFLYVINKPNRMIRKVIEEYVTEAMDDSLTLERTLENYRYDKLTKHERELEQFDKLIDTFESTVTKIDNNSPLWKILENIVKKIKYNEYLEDYYGKGETSYDRIMNINNFIEFSKEHDMTANKFLDYIEKLDTKRGKVEKDCLMMTSIFKAKGTERKYVIIPNCNEGYMPSKKPWKNDTSDIRKIKAEKSITLENERRLFYVAITRGKKAVYIGTGSPDDEKNKRSRFLNEIKIEETKKVITSLQKFMTNSNFDIKSVIAQFFHQNKIVECLKAYFNRMGNKQMTSYVDHIKQETDQQKIKNTGPVVTKTTSLNKKSTYRQTYRGGF